MTALEMRALARECVLACGGRGFMRFASAGALLACDAGRRCGEETLGQIVAALHDVGFEVTLEGGMLQISPGDTMLKRICIPLPPKIDWDGPLYAVQALAARFLAAPDLPLTPAGRELVIEALRLTGRPGEDVLSGIGMLRAQAAEMLRRGDRSGMRVSGAILAHWCALQEREEPV